MDENKDAPFVAVDAVVVDVSWESNRPVPKEGAAALGCSRAKADATPDMLVAPGLRALLTRENPLAAGGLTWEGCCSCAAPFAVGVPNPIANSMRVGTLGTGGAGVDTGPKGFLVPVWCDLTG